MPTKKASTKKSAAAPASAKGPSYFELVKSAITELKDRTGSSRQAILNVVSSKKDNCDNKALNRALKSAVESGKLIQVKGSYKLSAAEKKPAATKKKTVAKTTTAAKKKTTTVKKKVPSVKKTTKKAAPKKTTTKKKPASATKSKTKTKTATKSTTKKTTTKSRAKK